MPFTNNIDTSQPTGTENANTIDDIIRNVRLQMKERFDSLTTGADIDPMRLRAGAIPSGYSLTSPTISSPTISNPTLTGTITGLPPNYPPYVNGTALGFSPTIVNSWVSMARFSSLAVGTYLVFGYGQGLGIPGSSTAMNTQARFSNGTNIITGLQQSSSGLVSFQSLYGVVFGLLTTTIAVDLDFQFQLSGTSITSPNIAYGASFVIRVA